MDRTFDRSFWGCPFAVASDLLRYLPTNSEVNPGHVVKNSASVAFLRVFVTGLSAALCKKEMVFFFLTCTHYLLVLIFLLTPNPIVLWNGPYYLLNILCRIFIL